MVVINPRNIHKSWSYLLYPQYISDRVCVHQAQAKARPIYVIDMVMQLLPVHLTCAYIFLFLCVSCL